MDYTQEQLDEVFKKLPTDLKDAIVAVETADIIRQASVKHHLHVDQMGELAEETGLVMMGLTRPGQYIGNLARRLHISNDLAREIAKEIDEKIFRPVKDSLQKVRGFEVEDPTVATPPAEPPAENKEVEKEAGDKQKPSENESGEENRRDIFAEKMSSLFTNRRADIEDEENPDKTEKQNDGDTDNLALSKERIEKDPYKEPLE
ncbi:MAG: hypothetical protein WDZ85_03195 [Candidatus Paceibacterota bacterium]